MGVMIHKLCVETLMKIWEGGDRGGRARAGMMVGSILSTIFNNYHLVFSSNTTSSIAFFSHSQALVPNLE